jgi:hypothetical protein
MKIIPPRHHLEFPRIRRPYRRRHSANKLQTGVLLHITKRRRSFSVAPLSWDSLFLTQLQYCTVLYCQLSRRDGAVSGLTVFHASTASVSQVSEAFNVEIFFLNGRLVVWHCYWLLNSVAKKSGQIRFDPLNLWSWSGLWFNSLNLFVIR